MTRQTRRRTLLGVGGAFLGAFTSSGCTDERLTEAEHEPEPAEGVPKEDLDLPVEQRFERAEAAIERADGASFSDLEGFEGFLRDEGIDVESLTEETKGGEEVVSLESAFEHSSDGGFVRHLGTVAGGYAVLVAGGHESEKLEASLLDEDARTFGTYDIWRHWAEQYDEGELTAREYAGEIMVTAETT